MTGGFNQPTIRFEQRDLEIAAPASRIVRVFSISPIDAAYWSGDAQQAFPSSPRPFGFAPAVSSARITSALLLRDAAAFRSNPNTPPRSCFSGMSAAQLSSL